MKKIRFYIILAAIITALIFIKAKFFTSNNGKEVKAGKDGKGNKKPPTPVSVYVVSHEKLENRIEANGTVLANEETELKSEASGRIVLLNLPEGKIVKTGTLLLKINDAEQRAQLDKLKVQLKFASDNEYRQRQLFDVKAISKQEYEVAQTALMTLKADSAYIQAQIFKTELRAPFDGVIGIKNVSLGSYVTSANVITTIHQIDPVKIEFTLPEKYTTLFKVGDDISFKTEGSSQEYIGKIYVKDPAVDLVSRSVRFHALSKNPQGLLLPGAFAKVHLTVNEKSEAMFVPTEAIVPVAKGKKVFIVKDGKAKEKMVETGIRTADYLQVLSGVQIGDSVVINGNFNLKNESQVKVNKPKKQS